MGVQFAVPSSSDLSVSGIGGSFREEANGSRNLKVGSSYRANRNSGYYLVGDNSVFFPRIIIKNNKGEILETIDQRLRKVPPNGSGSWDLSITENFPYSILKDESLTVTVSFHSGKGAYRPRYANGTICNINCPSSNFSGLLSSNIKTSSLIQLVNVQEETRIANIETERLAVIEKSRLAVIEKARLTDIENKRLMQLSNDTLLLAEIRSSGFKVSEGRLLQLLNQEKNQNITFNEQVNSGDFNQTPITDINLSGGCSECTEPEHQMPDGSMMKDSEMEKKPLNSNMKFAGIAAAGVIGLLLYSKGGLK